MGAGGGEAAALGPDARDEKREVGGDFAQAGQLLGLGGADDEAAGARVCGVPLYGQAGDLLV